MIRIGVLGTCHLHGFVASLNAFLPDAEVTPFFLGMDVDIDAVHACARDADVFFTQPISNDAFGALCTERLPQARLQRFPLVTFTGFHPDTFIPDAGLESPIAGYHSALIAAAHGLGLPVARIPALFNRYVYGELGYLAEFERSKRFMLSQAADVGFDLTDSFDRWVAGRSFMHTVNHPRIEVLHDLARRSLVETGLIGPSDTAPLPPDAIAYIRWPVHAVVAAHAGVATEPDFVHQPDVLDLSAFAQACYMIYDRTDPAVLAQAGAVQRAAEGLRRIGVR